MLNTLANHGFLPHNGKDITRKQTQDALSEALNIESDLASFLFDFAITTNPKANASTFSLNDLGNHNILEHDASLRYISLGFLTYRPLSCASSSAPPIGTNIPPASRPDAFFGNALAFNETTFSETKSHWTGETITMQMAANARQARIKTSQATNPEYELSDLGSTFSFGESAAYVVVLGDKNTQTVNRTWVEWFFGKYYQNKTTINVKSKSGELSANLYGGAEHERLPLHMGWDRPTAPFSQADLFQYIDVLRNLTSA